MQIKPFENNSPWLWIPSLYFVQGIPYFLVNTISIMLMTKMGVPNGEMALFTSLLYLPWSIKPLWSPFIEIFKTKRWWMLSMQLMMAVAFILLACTLPNPSPETIAAGKTPISLFTFTLLLFTITAFASATHDIAADGFYMYSLKPHDQAAFVGIRSTAYRLSSAFGQGILVGIAGFIEYQYQNIPLSWSITIGLAAILLTLFAFYHLFAIPKPTNDKSILNSHNTSALDIIKEFIRTFTAFFTKPGVWIAIVFMLLYRLPESLLIKMCMPFLSAKKAAGGLELSTAEVGLAYGIIGTIALSIGGIIGGWFIATKGLKKSLWLMAGSITLPCFVFVLFAIYQPSNLWIITSGIALDQFGYGFGFTAYMLYMIYFSEGKFKTSHYAFCTAIMAQSMMIPGMFAGYLQESFGYKNFFWLVMLCCLVTFLVTFLISKKIDSNFGKK